MPNIRYQEEYIRRIHKVQDYIEQHLAQQMTIEELACVAGFSKYHFSRIFQGVLQEPLAHYVNRLRMENALFLLAHRKDMNMTDIAYESGYTDSAIFSRAFKNNYGVSPREYRSEYSKNCKEIYLISDYNKDTAQRECKRERYPVIGDVTIEEVEERQIAYVRHTGTYETLAVEFPKLLHTLMLHANEQNLIEGEENWVLAIYHDNPEFGCEEQFRTSLCVTVPKDRKVIEDGVLASMQLIGGLYAVGHFRIQQEEFSDAWNYMYYEWLTCSGYVPRNTYPFEVYRNDPSTDEENYIEVDIYVPIEPITF